MSSFLKALKVRPIFGSFESAVVGSSRVFLLFNSRSSVVAVASCRRGLHSTRTSNQQQRRSSFITPLSSLPVAPYQHLSHHHQNQSRQFALLGRSCGGGLFKAEFWPKRDIATLNNNQAPSFSSHSGFPFGSPGRSQLLRGKRPSSGAEEGLSSVPQQQRSKSKMPPVGVNLEAIKAQVESLVKEHPILLFSKTWCPFCNKVKTLFKDLGLSYHVVELDLMETDEGTAWQDALTAKTGQRTVPSVFVKGQHIGGCDDTFKAYRDNKLLAMIKGEDGSSTGDADRTAYDYDLIVIGGGSGGLAASKAAGNMGMKVAVCDFVQPTPIGTSWGLGGTCVNVGCIPKKLFHQAALLGQNMGDAPSFGWNLPALPSHEWAQLVENVQMYIKSLNWGYRVALKDASVTYLNEYARFVDPHTIETVNKKGKKQTLTANKFLVAVGGRPRYPEIPGSLELSVTSDDIFSLPYHPGKVLCIGASYIALECAGFLSGIGIETSVMVRSILLRGFDQQIAEMIGDHMEGHGVKFYRGWIPTEIVKIEEGTPPKLLVRAKETNGDETIEVEVNTVLLAIGRDPCTKALTLENAGVQLSKSGKIITNEADQSSTSNIFAIGDVAEGRPELTPVAIHAGNLLAKRLAEGSTILTDYDKVPTTVFTPLEYGCVGLSEEDAIKKYTADDIEVYHTNFQPLEATLSKRDENKSYCKLVCLKSENERVVGFHYVGPNAGEVTQGFALGIKMGATKTDFDSTIGIHPTTAETFTTMNITKSSGKSALKTGC